MMCTLCEGNEQQLQIIGIFLVQGLYMYICQELFDRTQNRNWPKYSYYKSEFRIKCQYVYSLRRQWTETIDGPTDRQPAGRQNALSSSMGVGGGIKLYEMFEITRCLSYQSSKEYLLTWTVGLNNVLTLKNFWRSYDSLPLLSIYSFGYFHVYDRLFTDYLYTRDIIFMRVNLNSRFKNQSRMH